MPEKKIGCNRSVCPFTQTEEQYVRTDGQTVYLRDQTTITPSLANLPIRMIPPGNPFTAPLQSSDGITYGGEPVGSLLDNHVTKRQEADILGSGCGPRSWGVDRDWVLINVK